MHTGELQCTPESCTIAPGQVHIRSCPYDLHVMDRVNLPAEATGFAEVCCPENPHSLGFWTSRSRVLAMGLPGGHLVD